MEETAISDIFLQLSEEPSPEPTPVDPVSPMIQTGDALFVMIVVLAFLVILSLIVFLVWARKQAHSRKIVKQIDMARYKMLGNQNNDRLIR